jgi:hypothetical protein
MIRIENRTYRGADLFFELMTRDHDEQKES